MKTIKYAFLTVIIAYVLAAVPATIFFATWGRGALEPVVDIRGVLGSLTLLLSGYWGNFYYLAILVPWLFSGFVLILLVHRFNRGARTRTLFAGLSVFAYYLAACLFLMIRGLIHGWGDIDYAIIWLWPLFGFGFGYAAGIIAEKSFKPRIKNR